MFKNSEIIDSTFILSYKLIRPLDSSGEEVKDMLNWAIVFLIVAIIAGILGFSGVAGSAATIAWVLFVAFLILFVIALIAGRGPSPGPPDR